MKENEILQAAQEHGDWAFLQGFKAAKAGIKLEDNATLSRMPEALRRLDEFRKIVNIVENTNIQI